MAPGGARGMVSMRACHTQLFSTASCNRLIQHDKMSRRTGPHCANTSGPNRGGRRRRRRSGGSAQHGPLSRRERQLDTNRS